MNPVFINYPLETFTPTASGALATILFHTATAAAAAGCEPHIITRESAVPAFDWPHLTQVPFEDAPANRLAHKFLRARRKLGGWRHLRHHAWSQRVAHALETGNLVDRPLVLLNDPETAVYLRRRFPAARIIHWFQNQLECSDRVRREFPQAADVVLGVSRFTADWISAYYAIPHVETLHNAVDTSAFSPAPIPPPGPLIINFVGRTGIEKAPDTLLKAALLIAGNAPPFALQLLGSNHWDRFELDDYQRQLRDLAVQLVSKHIPVRMPGHISRANLPAELRKAHIHVTPSRWQEPFGMTTLEAMASGLATLATSTGGTPEVLADAGLLFPPDNPDALAAHLHSLLTDPALRLSLAAKARDRAQTFTWTGTWNRLSHLLAADAFSAPTPASSPSLIPAGT